MKHRISLNLIISDFDGITHDEISHMLELNPIKVYIKGQKKKQSHLLQVQL